MAPIEVTAGVPESVTHQRVLVIGQGYVGLPLAEAAVIAGHDVTAIDIDSAKVKAIRASQSPIEDVTDADLAAMHDTGRYTCTDSPEDARAGGFDVAIVTVPTPLRDGRPDLAAVLEAARTVGYLMEVSGRMRGGFPLVVLESTVAPGTTGGVFTQALEEAAHLRAGGDFHVAFSPERIDPGNQTWRFANTPKLVGGVTPNATEHAARFYRSICHTVVSVETAEVAEAAKLLENTFRHVNIALVNELGQHLHALGISPWDVIRAAATKPYGFMPFYPGPGVGGHCLPIDPEYLADAVQRETGRAFHFIELAMRVNRAQPAYIVQRITEMLNTASRAVRGSKILIVGAAYKANTGDMRESPAVEIINRLAALGADLVVYEPHATRPASDQLVRAAPAGGYLAMVTHRETLIGRMDRDGYALAVILTDHTDVPYDEIVRAVPRVLDTRGVYAHNTEVVETL